MRDDGSYEPMKRALGVGEEVIGDAYDELLGAVYDLYYSAHWVTTDVSDDKAVTLWERVRDAAGFGIGKYDSIHTTLEVP